MEIEDDTYSSIFQALKHPIRRKILRMLNEHPYTYSEILNELGIDNGLLNYHLESMNELVTKTENDYVLSRFGEAAVQMTSAVEMPPPIKLRGEERRRLRIMVTALSICVLVIMGSMAGLFYLWSSQGRMIKALSQDVESFTEKLDRYSLLDSMLESSSSTILAMGREMKFSTSSYLEPNNYQQFVMVFYVPDNNATLSIETALNMPEGFYFPLTIQKGDAFVYPSDRVKDPNALYMEAHQSPIIWEEKMSTGFKTLKVLLDEGWYTLSWFGQVTVYRDSHSEVHGWCSMDKWQSAAGSTVWSYCRLVKNDTYIPFIIDTWMRAQRLGFNLWQDKMPLVEREEEALDSIRKPLFTLVSSVERHGGDGDLERLRWRTAWTRGMHSEAAVRLRMQGHLRAAEYLERNIDVLLTFAVLSLEGVMIP